MTLAIFIFLCAVVWAGWETFARYRLRRQNTRLTQAIVELKELIDDLRLGRDEDQIIAYRLLCEVLDSYRGLIEDAEAKLP